MTKHPSFRIIVALLPLLVCAASLGVALGSSEPRLVERVGSLEGCGGVAVAYSGDGKLIITAARRYARAWDAATARAVTRPLDHGGAVAGVAISADGRTAVTFGGTWDVSGPRGVYRGSGAKVWDGKTGRLLLRINEHEPGHSVWDADVSPNGTIIATCAHGDHSVRLWNAATGKQIARLDMPDEVGFVVFSPGGTRIVAVQDRVAGARLWAVRTGKPIGDLVGANGDRSLGVQRAACFSRDGRILALCNSDRFTVVDALIGKKIIDSEANQLSIEGDTFCSVSLSDDGKVLVTTATMSGSRPWRTLTAEPLGKNVRDRGVPAVVSPDGRYMLCGQRWSKTGTQLVKN